MSLDPKKKVPFQAVHTTGLPSTVPNPFAPLPILLTTGKTQVVAQQEDLNPEQSINTGEVKRIGDRSIEVAMSAMQRPSSTTMAAIDAGNLAAAAQRTGTNVTASLEARSINEPDDDTPSIAVHDVDCADDRLSTDVDDDEDAVGQAGERITAMERAALVGMSEAAAVAEDGARATRRWIGRQLQQEQKLRKLQQFEPSNADELEAAAAAAGVVVVDDDDDDCRDGNDKDDSKHDAGGDGDAPSGGGGASAASDSDGGRHPHGGEVRGCRCTCRCNGRTRGTSNANSDTNTTSNSHANISHGAAAGGVSGEEMVRQLVAQGVVAALMANEVRRLRKALKALRADRVADAQRHARAETASASALRAAATEVERLTAAAAACVEEKEKDVERTHAAARSEALQAQAAELRQQHEREQAAERQRHTAEMKALKDRSAADANGRIAAERALADAAAAAERAKAADEQRFDERVREREAAARAEALAKVIEHPHTRIAKQAIGAEVDRLRRGDGINVKSKAKAKALLNEKGGSMWGAVSAAVCPTKDWAMTRALLQMELTARESRGGRAWDETWIGSVRESWPVNCLVMAGSLGAPLAVALGMLGVGVSARVPDEQGQTALFGAADGGNVSLCGLLIALGADVNARRLSNGWTALHAAAALNRLDVIPLLLTAGADVAMTTTDEHKETAQQLAARSGHTAVVGRLRKPAWAA